MVKTATGDNLSETIQIFDADNDGYNDSIDPLPKLAAPVI